MYFLCPASCTHSGARIKEILRESLRMCLELAPELQRAAPISFPARGRAARVQQAAPIPARARAPASRTHSGARPSSSELHPFHFRRAPERRPYSFVFPVCSKLHPFRRAPELQRAAPIPARAQAAPVFLCIYCAPGASNVSPPVALRSREANPKGFKLIAKNQLGDEIFATPVICGNRIYQRVAHRDGSKRQEILYCIGVSR